MPLPKSATKRQKAQARLEYYHARQAAIQYFGEDLVKGHDVHHKNGNRKDNRRANLDLKPKNKHGRTHGRGVSSSLPMKQKMKIKLRRAKKYL